jgi:transglutaminase-like putative cysteine protease
VRNWRIDVSTDARLRRLDDPFGDIAHYLTIDGPVEEVVITAVGEVETDDSHGVVKGAIEKLPVEVYLRHTPLTAPDARIAAFAGAAKADSDGSPLDIAHALAKCVHRDIVFDTRGTTVTTPAAEVLEKGAGVCQDLTHLYLAAARSLGFPARYVGGYMYDAGSPQPHEAGHAWAEVHVADFGWVGFDATGGIAPTDAHVRVAVGLDYLGAAPVRGARTGGGKEKLTVELWVTRLDQPAASQTQWQSEDGGPSQSLSGMTQTQTQSGSGRPKFSPP